MKNYEFRRTKLLIATIFSIVFCFSCNQTKVEQTNSKIVELNQVKSSEIKAENICTLTPEQVPEVRGLRVGLSVQQLEQRYPNLFKPSTPMSLDLGEAFPGLSTFSKKRTQRVLWGNVADVNKFSELDGVHYIGLLLDNEIVEGFGIFYDIQNDKTFHESFKQKMIDSLGISAFTNGQDSTYELVAGIQHKQFSLLCNQVEILISTTNFLDLPTESVHPKLVIKKVERVAQTQAQIKNDKERKEGESKRKAETFKP